jgi:hypothetical protein
MLSKERKRYIAKIYTLNCDYLMENFKKEIKIYGLI